MIPLSIEAIDKITISTEEISLSKEDLAKITESFCNLSIIKYLKHLKSDLYNDHARIDLKTYSENRDLYAVQQAFVKGGINAIETLLQIHKSQPK